MKSQRELRKRLSHLLLHGTNRQEVKDLIANMLINEMDNLLLIYWGHLGDMGMPRKDFDSIKRKVKRRL